MSDIRYLSFSDLTSLNMTVSSYINVAKNGIILFFFIIEEYSTFIECLYHIFFTLLLTDI